MKNAFKEILDQIAATPSIAPPDGFTARVMARLPERKAAIRQFSLRRLFRTPVFTTDLTFGFQRPVAKTECAFYFLLIGFFYFILGIILMIGLKPMTASLPVTGWFGMQPVFSLISALCLIAIGVGLYRDGHTAVWVARIGTLLYAVLVILNGWIGIVSTHVSVAIFIAAICSVTGLGMAFFLGIAIDRYAPENIYSQGVRV